MNKAKCTHWHVQKLMPLAMSKMKEKQYGKTIASRKTRRRRQQPWQTGVILKKSHCRTIPDSIPIPAYWVAYDYDSQCKADPTMHLVAIEASWFCQGNRNQMPWGKFHHLHKIWTKWRRSRKLGIHMVCGLDGSTAICWWKHYQRGWWFWATL